MVWKKIARFPTASSTFGARRGMWLDQVHGDPEMTGDFCRVMYAISQRLNRGSFTTFAGDPDLAALAKVSTRTVQRARERAVERGHISQVFRGCKRMVITPLLASEGGQSVHVQGGEGGQSNPEGGQKGGQPERGPPVESNGCAPNSQTLNNNSHTDFLRNWKPKGAFGPKQDKEEPSSRDLSPETP